MALNLQEPVSTVEMAAILDVSPRRLQQLIAGGWIIGRVRHGRWNIPETVRSYTTHRLLSAARGKDSSV